MTVPSGFLPNRTTGRPVGARQTTSCVLARTDRLRACSSRRRNAKRRARVVGRADAAHVEAAAAGARRAAAVARGARETLVVARSRRRTADLDDDNSDDDSFIVDEIKQHTDETARIVVERADERCAAQAQVAVVERADERRHCATARDAGRSRDATAACRA